MDGGKIRRNVCLLLLAAAAGFPGIYQENLEKARINAEREAAAQAAALSAVPLPWQQGLFTPASGDPGTLLRSGTLTEGGGSPAAPEGDGPASPVTEGGGTLLTDANRVSGLALVSAAAASPGWEAPPAWASAHGPWQACGVNRDFFGILLTDGPAPEHCPWDAAAFPPFPVGTNLHTRLFVSSCGAVSFGSPARLWPDGRPAPDGSDAPLFAPLLGELGVAPPEGAFWHGVSPSNTLLLTWRDVYLNRDSNLAASAQCELRPSGDFALRVRLPEGADPSGFATAVQNAGGGEAFPWDSDTLALARSPGGVEIRGRGFGALPPGGDDGTDTDGDGLTDAEEIFIWGTDPRLPDTDFDGLSDAGETAAGTDPRAPDSDGDLAADSADPAPLAPADPSAVLNCCSNTWLFHVHNRLPADGAGCPLAGPETAEAWRGARFPVTVTLHADVPAPGAVLRVGEGPGAVPLVLRGAGSWTLWLDRLKAHPAVLCRRDASPCAHGIASDEPGFILQPAGDGGPPAPGERLLGRLAVPSPLSVAPDPACFHGSPVTLRASGSAAGLSGLYVWTYGGLTALTNAPFLTVPPDFGEMPPEVGVTFTPDAPAPQGGPAPLSAGTPGWPASGGGACAYCSRHTSTNTSDVWWCDLTAMPESMAACPAAGWAGQSAGGTNAFWTLPVNRRTPAPAWPGGGASLYPCPSAQAGQAGPPDPSDCGHGEGCPDCRWAGGHWHRRTETSGLFADSGCCACPAHNPRTAGASPEPVLLEGADGLAVSFRPNGGGAPFQLSPGQAVPRDGAVHVAGLAPSSAPLDRAVRFTRQDPGTPQTLRETDRFTVMSLDLQPDHDLSGTAGDSGDAPALAADWDREWLVPAGTGTWWAVKVFNDTALPGVYSVAVTGSSNVTARYGTVLTRGGETNAAAFPSGPTLETVEVQADGPGSATLTVSFRGSGSLTNYTCETSVDITAWGLEFVEDAGTRYNFSPSLGETGTVKVAAVNLPEGGMPGHHFRIEIVRETAGGGEQHIDWLDMTEGGTHDLTRPADFTAMPPFRWGGVPSQGFGSSAPQAEGRDSFQGVSASAARALPAVTLGQPVPPPFVTAVATVRRNSDQTVVASARRRVCIPQVVKLVYDADAVTRLMAGISSTMTNGPVLMYPMTISQWIEQKNRIKMLSQVYYDAIQANIRFCDDTVAVSPPYSTMRMNATETGVLGYAPPDYLNTNPNDEGSLLAIGFVDAVIIYFENDPDSAPPVTPAEMGNLWGHTIAHETGHMLGLVAPGQVLDGEDWHNKNPAARLVMNDGLVNSMPDRFGRNGAWSWRLLNANYLKFLLPKQ